MKKCKQCNFCKIIYRRLYGYSYSLKYPKFYCALRGEMIDREKSCDGWSKKKPEYDISVQRFYQAEEDINALLRLLKDI